MTEALYPRRKEIVLSLLDKYTLAGMATFMGSLLRLFAKTNKLVDSLADIDLIKRLA